MDATETLEQAQARHRKELKDLQGRITNKKKNATKKTRKGVNDECTELERQMKERHEDELRQLSGADTQDNEPEDDAEPGDGPNGDLEDKLQDMSISPSQPEHTPSENQNDDTAGQPRKKRNRQQERLARRAAEQVAAAEAAEAEAATMVDHRGLEDKAMQAVFAANGLEQKDIAPDGHCLFAAVADQLAHVHGMAVGEPVGVGLSAGAQKKELAYKTVRRVAAAYMEGHADDFAGFLEEPLEAHVTKIRDTAEWGGMLELNALANSYGVEIRVVQDGRTEVIRPGEVGDADELKKVWLAYYRHGYGLGEHYNSLRPVRQKAA